mmetsp:Transcript_11630/g.23158  ORF Transcript_11630/g.23158 Transcript_11630/m.23158 type:complete len:110 (+) Transcript_11630:134-463(+)|eukprot:CAMPEP_0182455510 /NCGR_PEP_ID=MMETSP1319-20130603/1643_1 /TAXON_ID=172717 /ORGANISM="Bolidomonas pacifica, Strain RCC208" /LENGTH=109 /DNA_ID=CAMNT_0024653581 /DNA_START=233 /DNA_END=562 /DNA_ORIENTATION=-
MSSSEPTIEPVCGGHSGANPVEEGSDIAVLVLELKDAILEAAGAPPADSIVPLTFRQQVVAGMIYHVKVSSGSDCIHARIFKPLPHTGQPAVVQKAQGGFAPDADLTVM